MWSKPVTLEKLAREMLIQIGRNLKASIGCFVLIVFLSCIYAVFRPAEYVASMVVVPIETSLTDATGQLLTNSISLRPQFSFGGPPPRMAAYLKILRSPQIATYLAKDPKSIAAIIGNSQPGILSTLKSDLHLQPPLETIEQQQNSYRGRVSQIAGWLSSHLTVDQDVDLMAWTINVRHADSESASYILSTVQKSGEDVLRTSAAQQYAIQRSYVLGQIAQSQDANIRTTLYSVLASIDRALIVLRSGSNVAAIVVSDPYVPQARTYPSRLLSLGIAFVVLSLFALVFLTTISYRALVKMSSDEGDAMFSQVETTYANYQR